MNPIRFGTDGWRAIIAQDFTFDNVRLCAQAVADYLQDAGLASKGLVIGYDTRFGSKDFASATAEVIAGNKVKVYLSSKPIPTPVTSFAVVNQQAGGGIIITASHNPANWNGFKFKTKLGCSASPEVTEKLEANIARIRSEGKIKQLPLAQALETGLVEYLAPYPAYYQQLTSLVDVNKLRQSNLKVVTDPMYGAGSGYFKKLLGGGTIKITEINNKPNPLFPGIRPEPIAVNLAKLSATVKRQHASIGLATDGDADRLGIIDENGTFISPLHTFALLCLYLLEIRGERGPIVKTVTMTSMAYRLGELFKVPVYETRVGFKYVAPVMLKNKALIGGEESGGYGFRGHIPERDGILAGLYLLDLMARTGKTPSELISYLYSRVGPHYYQRQDIEFNKDERQAITQRVKEYSPGSLDGVKVVAMDTTDGFRFTFADNSWLLIRFSGTEPILRIYAEGNTLSRAEKLVTLAQELVNE
ncbi:MAG: phosphoglucomutase/phosphomannomutase family protein [Dehalococcoidales bacterium]|nr:phosphoglucomutase/phosphomannomutase family protein [Dehalococcoidales bacterium]